MHNSENRQILSESRQEPQKLYPSLTYVNK
jgi:hypothetical protein